MESWRMQITKLKGWKRLMSPGQELRVVAAIKQTCGVVRASFRGRSACCLEVCAVTMPKRCSEQALIAARAVLGEPMQYLDNLYEIVTLLDVVFMALHGLLVADGEQVWAMTF